MKRKQFNIVGLIVGLILTIIGFTFKTVTPLEIVGGFLIGFCGTGLLLSGKS